jgi:hypothetical protein
MLYKAKTWLREVNCLCWCLELRKIRSMSNRWGLASLVLNWNTEIESCVYFDYNTAEILLFWVCLSIKISEFDGEIWSSRTYMDVQLKGKHQCITFSTSKLNRDFDTHSGTNFKSCGSCSFLSIMLFSTSDLIL